MNNAALRIGGAPVVTIRAPIPFPGPGFTEATILPGRGMMLLQLRLQLPSGEVVDALAAPSVAEAASALDGGPDDFAGNASFSFGGAILAPYANRICGVPVSGARDIVASVAGFPARLPRNWGGKAPGAEQYAMHGLILATPVPFHLEGPSRVTGELDAGSFGGRWPGRTRLTLSWTLEGGGLHLHVAAANIGETAVPVGIGWHPYFRVQSGDRTQARLSIPALARVAVGNYDEVLPTGEVQPVRGAGYDFNVGDGRPLGDLYLDDCFTEFEKETARPLVELRDPAARTGLRLASSSPHISALQVYAPPDEPYVVLEPQFNLPDPYGQQWRGRETGMVTVLPGQAVAYDVTLTAFAT
jgi:aldose 1-epimerase